MTIANPVRPYLKTCAAWAVLLASASVGAYQGHALYHVHHTNRWLADMAAGQEPSLAELRTAPPEVQLAQALRLSRQQRYDDALALLNRILASGDRPLQAAIRYNLGNVYLRQALAIVEGQSANAAIPLLALAKQAYRQALALDNGLWDARYNLDVAMRLLPELDRVEAPEDPDARQQTPLWTTVPGIPRGLP